VRRRRLPESARGGGPPTGGYGGHGSLTSMRGGGGLSIRGSGGGPRSMAADPRSRGEQRRGPCAGKRWHFQGWRASGAPRRASSDGNARGARFERRHGRHEVRAATIARDILRSGAVWVAQVTTYICACVVDDVLRRLPPLIHVFFYYYVLYLPHVLFTVKTI
jgi:hypothetical protein